MDALNIRVALGAARRGLLATDIVLLAEGGERPAELGSSVVLHHRDARIDSMPAADIVAALCDLHGGPVFAQSLRRLVIGVIGLGGEFLSSVGYVHGDSDPAYAIRRPVVVHRW